MGTYNQGAWPPLGGKAVRKVFLEGMIFAPRSKGYVSVNQVNSLKTLGGPGSGSDCVILEPMSESLGALFYLELLRVVLIYSCIPWVFRDHLLFSEH